MDSDPGLPPSVRAIWRARDLLTRRWRRALAALAVLVLGAVTLRGLYTVDNGETAAVLRFGALRDDAVQPGLHLRLPLGVEAVQRVRTGEVARAVVEADFTQRHELVTGDENLIGASLAIQYRITRLGDFLYSVEEVEAVLLQAARAALVESVASLAVDEVLTTAKAAVQQRVREYTQRRLDDYDAGITLVAVSLQEVSPPSEANDAFRSVADARAESAEKVSRARGEQERSRRLARGRAASARERAEAAAYGRTTAARGAAERFESLLAQKRRAPEQTIVDLRTRAVREILPRARLIVLAPGAAPEIDVQLLPRRSVPWPPDEPAQEHP
jgi:membrane protease subunit HflK